MQLRARDVPTPLFIARPSWVLDPGVDLTPDRLRTWSRHFEWRADPLRGFIDIAQSPQSTLNHQRGDCVDYARLVASVLAPDPDADPLLAVELYRWTNPVGHVVVYDRSTETIYSSGIVTDESLDTYHDRSQHDILLMTRQIEGIL